MKAAECATGMTADERIREGFRLFEHGRDYIVNSIRETFPDATNEEVERIRDIVLRRTRQWEII